MTSQTIGSNAQLRDLIDLFFQDVRAFGVFACHGTPKKEIVDNYIKNRLGILDGILQAAEPLLGITLENTSLPILANTVRWPEHTPIAGYITHGSGIKYSHVLSTYFGNWVYEYSHGPFYLRLIRAGLRVWCKDGLENAIQYLFDLQKYGYFTIEKGIEDTIAILMASQTLGKDPLEIAAAYFHGNAPQSEDDWMKGDFQIPQRVSTTPDRAMIQPMLECIIMDTLEEIENIRDLDDPAEWLLRQAACTTRCGIVMHLCKRFPIEQTIMLKSILSQFEEIHADGSVYMSYRTWAPFAPLKSPLSLQASYLPLMFRANFGEEGMERLYHDRLIYPAVLREPIAQYGVDALRENKDFFAWSIVPPGLFHPYAVFFSPGYPDLTLRTAFFSIEQIGEIPAVRAFFEQQGIQTQEERIGMLHQVYLGRLNWTGRALDSGNVLVTPTKEQREQLQEVLALSHRALCYKELQEDLIASINTADIEEKERILNRLRFLYPWNPALYQELAIFSDERGDLQQAWNAILMAVLLEPDKAMGWQSLGVILQRLGDTSGAQFARVMKAFLMERDKQ